jgi:hypothetical protein
MSVPSSLFLERDEERGEETYIGLVSEMGQLPTVDLVWSGRLEEGEGRLEEVPEGSAWLVFVVQEDSLRLQIDQRAPDGEIRIIREQLPSFLTLLWLLVSEHIVYDVRYPAIFRAWRDEVGRDEEGGRGGWRKRV